MKGLYNPRPVDDTPVNGQLAHGVTSNWAFDHAVATAPHPNLITQGMVTLLPFAELGIVGQGTWATSIDAANSFLQFYLSNGAGADADNISFEIYLDKGTYTLKMGCLTTTSKGKVDIDINGTEIASFDLYSGALTYNVVKSQANIVVATAGRYTLKLRVDGKNDLSSGFGINPSWIIMWRTA